MPSLRVGVVVRWPEVEQLVRVMLRQMGHQMHNTADPTPPDVVVRDARCEPPQGWADRPTVVLCGSALGAVEESTGIMRLLKPFTYDQLDAAIQQVTWPFGDSE